MSTITEDIATLEVLRRVLTNSPVAPNDLAAAMAYNYMKWTGTPAVMELTERGETALRWSQAGRQAERDDLEGIVR